MKDIFNDFRFVPDGTSTLVDAVSSFIKEEIAFGRIKGGEKLPTIGEISKATGLTFAQARRVVECLAREGHVHSRPHTGTIVLSHEGNVLRGRVLLALPDVDVCRYHPAQVMDVLGRRLAEAGYAFSVAPFSLDPHDKLAHLKNELLRSTDLVIAARATPKVQKCLAESGVNHVFAYGDKPKYADRPWIRFAAETALVHFAHHCAKAGVRHVVQVRFEGNETLDARPALAKKRIASSWMTILRSDGGRRRFDGVVRCAYEAFANLPSDQIPKLLLFWNSFVAQGASIAFLARGIRIPEDVKVVTLSDAGVAPVYTKSFTRFEIDPIAAGEKVADFALAVLAKGRVPAPPKISPQYVFGETFPFRLAPNPSLQERIMAAPDMISAT